MNLTFLDCTLRDGGYYNQWDFSIDLINDYIHAMEATGIDVIELGFRFTPKQKYYGPTAYTSDDFVATLTIAENTRVGIMLNAADFINDTGVDKEALASAFPNEAANTRISLVRVACHFKDFATALPIASFLKGKGYAVGFNIMQIGDRNDIEIAEAAEAATSYPLDVLYFADSLGNLTPSRTQQIVRAIKSKWPGEIGIHTHDNMGMAIANTLAAIEEGVTWVDGTVTGMGRGPGNAQTELLLAALKDKWSGNNNMVDILKLVRQHFGPMKDQYGWGTNPFYYLAGDYGIHPSYVQTMLDDKRYNEEDILAVIEYLKTVDSKSYRVKNLELGRKVYHEPKQGNWNPKEAFEGKEVLLLGAGPGVKNNRNAIEAYIEKYKPVVVALNAKNDLPDINVNYWIACHPVRLLSDVKRYQGTSKPIIMPFSMLDEQVQQSFALHTILDFGLEVKEEQFAFHDYSCTIPGLLVLAYALGILNSGKARQIKLAGFDGYAPGDVRQQESEEVFDIYHQITDAASILSILNTSYKIPINSVYSSI